MNSFTLLLILGATAAMAWGGTRLTITHAMAWGLEDIPNARSSHARITPRGGGAAIVVACIGGSLLLALAQTIQPTLPPAGRLIPCLLPALLLAVIGLWDDRHPLSIRLRLAVQIICVASLTMPLSGQISTYATTAWGVPGGLAVILPLILLLAGLWWVNLFNFMDGIDGLAASQAIFMLLGGILLRCLSLNAPSSGSVAGLMAMLHSQDVIRTPISIVSLIIGAATAGFLIYNWAPARIFMGDTGSLFLGCTVLAIMALDTAADPASPAASMTCWLILSALFMTDATVTLLRRLLSGQSAGAAHRSHAYQRLSRYWGSHARVTLVYCLINVGWLLPLAVWARLQPGTGGIPLLLAYLPLVPGACLLGAGRKEPVS